MKLRGLHGMGLMITRLALMLLIHIQFENGLFGVSGGFQSSLGNMNDGRCTGAARTDITFRPVFYAP